MHPCGDQPISWNVTIDSYDLDTGKSSRGRVCCISDVELSAGSYKSRLYTDTKARHDDKFDYAKGIPDDKSDDIPKRQCNLDDYVGTISSDESICSDANYIG